MSRHYDSRVNSLVRWATSQCWVKTDTVLGQRCVNWQFDCEAATTYRQGPDPICVQEIGLHFLPRILFQYQTTRHVILAPWRCLVWIWELPHWFYHWKTSVGEDEMPACPALLKQRSATRTRLKIVHWPVGKTIIRAIVTVLKLPSLEMEPPTLTSWCLNDTSVAKELT